MSKRISVADRRLLEELEQKYSPETVLGVITQCQDGFIISPASSVETDPSEYDSLPLDEAVLEFLKKLEGYRIRFREFHWNAQKMSMHNLTDDIMSELLKLEDEIAEDMQGLLGIRIKVGMLVPELPDTADFNKTLVKLLEDVLTMKASIEDVKEACGMISMLDDIVHFINKSFYLGSFN